MANPLQFESFRPLPPECLHCEELLADAVDALLAPDDVLSPADCMFFDRHLATCAHCTQAFAEASRGAAWLDMLKHPRPEPSAQLLDRILMQTTGAQNAGNADFEALSQAGPLPSYLPVENVTDFVAPRPLAPVYPAPERPAAAPNVLPFVPRAPRFMPAFNRFLFEPRLAMTAAMAFFSIALTLNLTGVKLNQLHAEDLRPSHLRRSYYEAQASVARHYEGLRVVQTLEARVDDLREANQDDSARPESRPEPKPEPRPEPRQQSPEPAQPSPEPAQPAAKPSAPNPNAISRRSEPFVQPRLFPVVERKLVPATAAPLTRKEGGLA